MSDPTQPIPTDPAEEPAPAGPSSTVIGVAVGVVVILLVIVLIVVTRDGEPDEVLPTAPVTTEPTPEPTTEPPTPAPTTEPPTPEPTEEPEGPREPTDADAASFANRYEPPGGEQAESVAVDVNGDGRKEVVFASVVSDTVRIDVAAWDGQAYQVVYVGQGGPAERLDRFVVRDFTDDDSREIVTFQSVGDEGESLSVWGWDGQRYADQRAQGGCWNGQNTYGIVGASISDGEIVATCDGSPLPRATWPSDVYRWNGMAWVYEETRTPQ